MAASKDSAGENLSSDVTVACKQDGHDSNDSLNKGIEIEEDTTRYSDRNLIINYIPSALTDQQLLLLFSRVGPVKNCRIIRDKQTQQSYGFGFCEFETAQHAQEAISLFNGHKVGSKILKVAFARLPGQESKNCNLFVQNLPISVDREELYRVFAQFGRIVQCRLIADSQGRSRRIGFVLYESRSAAAAARDALNDRVWPTLIKLADSNESDGCDSRVNTKQDSDSILSTEEETMGLEFSPNSKDHGLVKVQFAAENSKKCRSILGSSNTCRTTGIIESPPVSSSPLLASMNALSLGSSTADAGRYLLPASWCDMGAPAAAIPILPSPSQFSYPFLLNFSGAPEVVPLVFNTPINLGPALRSKTGVSAYRSSLLTPGSTFAPQLSSLPFQSSGLQPSASGNQAAHLLFPVNTPSGEPAHSSARFYSIRSPTTCPKSLIANTNTSQQMQSAIGTASNSGRLSNIPSTLHHSQLSPPSEPPFVLYIYNIGNNMTEEMLREIFKPFGSPRKVDVPRETSSNIQAVTSNGGITSSKNYGFVTYDHLDSALAAMRALNGFILEGRQLQVSFRKEKPHSISNVISTGGKNSANHLRMRMINSALQQSHPRPSAVFMHQSPWVTVPTVNNYTVTSATSSSATA